MHRNSAPNAPLLTASVHEWLDYYEAYAKFHLPDEQRMAELELMSRLELLVYQARKTGILNRYCLNQAMAQAERIREAEEAELQQDSDFFPLPESGL